MLDRVAMAQAEVRGAALGDARRTARLSQVAHQLAVDPQKSLPKQAGSIAALEATYRFLSNDAIEPAAILAPHHNATRSRALAHGGGTLVVHDSTEFDFGKREQLGELNGGARRGFFGHVSLVVTSDESRRPLGVAACEMLFRESLKKNAPTARRQNEGARWRRGIDAANAQLEGLHRIHVADREADAYELMNHVVELGDDFVFRANADRLLDRAKTLHLRDALAVASPLVGRGFSVGKRPKNPSPRHAKRHPERNAHVVRAEISATSVELRRPRGAKGAPTLKLHVVHVRELLDTGDAAQVEWILWTTLPIETAEQILFIVDAYRARWQIEELFKALKTGCGFEKLQLESRRAITNALAVYLPVAWLQLHLRAVSRDPTAPVSVVLSEHQVFALRIAYQAQEKKRLPDALSARDALLAIARLGGHLKNNGDPGWLTIGRGMHDVLLVELGILAAQGATSHGRDPINP
jgi:hypothetical protein